MGGGEIGLMAMLCVSRSNPSNMIRGEKGEEKEEEEGQKFAIAYSAWENRGRRKKGSKSTKIIHN